MIMKRYFAYITVCIIALLAASCIGGEKKGEEVDGVWFQHGGNGERNVEETYDDNELRMRLVWPIEELVNNLLVACE